MQVSAEATRPRRADGGARPRLEDTGPEAGASVMATGIVSIGLSLTGEETLSRVLLAVAGALWLLVVALAVRRLVRSPSRFAVEAGSPAALTSVAGTAVVGSRMLMLGWNDMAEAALALAFCLWLVLVPLVLLAWRRPTRGVSFVLAVSTESLAVLAAGTAAVDEEEWLALAAVALFTLGVGAYVFVLASFDLRELLAGLGDHWVAGGALAIATLAAADVARATDFVHVLEGMHSALADLALAVWCAAALWLPVLLVAELVRPRLRYDVRRWSTVFPFGMYAVCSFVTGEEVPLGGLDDFARVWIWVALAVWGLVVVGLVRRMPPWGLGLRRREREAAEGELGLETDG